MSSSVVPVETDFVAQPTAAQALAANPARAYLQIQNQSAGVITYKFGGDFNAAVNEVQHVAFNRVPTGGTWSLSKSPDTAALAYNDNAAAIQAALEALGSIGANNVTVAGDYTVGFDITFIGALAAMPVGLLTLTSALTDNTAASNAVQAINFDQPPTGGVFAVAFNGEPTGDLGYNMTAAQLKAALNLLGGIAGGVSATAQDGTTKDFSVTMGNAPLASAAQPLLTLVSSTLTGSANQATQVQTLYGTPAPIRGTFQLSNGIQTSAALNYDCSAVDIQAALVAMSSIGAGGATVAGASFAAGFVITSAGSKTLSVQPQLFVVNQLLQADDLNTDVTDGLALDEIDPDDVKLTMVTNVLGHGLDLVNVTFATTTPGGAAADVQTTETLTVAGQATGVDGVDVQVAAGELWDAEVPTSSLWIKSVGANAPVTILEG